MLWPQFKVEYIEIPYTYGDVLDALFADAVFRIYRIDNNRLRVVSDSPDFKKNIEDYIESIKYSTYISIDDYYIDWSYNTNRYVYELYLNEKGLEKFDSICLILELQGKIFRKYKIKYIY